MSVAVFSADALLARMLLLEARRCGLAEALPEQARVWLIDLDHPQPLPKKSAMPLCIGFSSRPEAVESATRSELYALLPLPLCAKRLGALLFGRDTPTADTLLREGGQLFLGGKRLCFSKTEQSVLSLLYENRHRAVTANELAAAIGESAVNSNAAAVYLYRLRRKLEADGIMRIRTVRGVGYRWIGD